MTQLERALTYMVAVLLLVVAWFIVGPQPPLF